MSIGHSAEISTRSKLTASFRVRWYDDTAAKMYDAIDSVPAS